MVKASCEVLRKFFEEYIHFNVVIEVPRPGSLPAYHPAVMSYSVVKAYWDYYCLCNDYLDIVAYKDDLISFMKEEYSGVGIQFVDEEERIIFAMIRREKIVKYLH